MTPSEHYTENARLERMSQERRKLEKKLHKILKVMTNQAVYEQFPRQERDLLRDQYHKMAGYYDVLAIRIERLVCRLVEEAAINE